MFVVFLKSTLVIDIQVLTDPLFWMKNDNLSYSKIVQHSIACPTTLVMSAQMEYHTHHHNHGQPPPPSVTGQATGQSRQTTRQMVGSNQGRRPQQHNQTNSVYNNRQNKVTIAQTSIKSRDFVWFRSRIDLHSFFRSLCSAYLS